MAITGTTLFAYFNQRYDQSYSGFYDSVKANRLFRNVMFTCTDRRGLDTDSQKAFDEIAQQIITQRTFPINNNRIATAPLLITNIVRVLGTVTVTTFFPHNLLITDVVTFSDLTGAYITFNGIPFPLSGIVDATTFTFINGAVSTTPLANTGSLTFSKMVSDYLHLYAVKTKFTQPQTGLRVVATSGVSPITIRLGNRSKFRDGSIITLTGMTSTPAANGTWYVKQLNTTSYQLFTDANLTIPSTGGVNSNTIQGAVSYVWYEYATPYFSARKIDQLDSPSAELPKYEFAEKVIKFYPDDLVCSEITIDYIRVPQYFIDVADNVFDLSLVYPEPYLYFIINQSIKSISLPLRDGQLNQMINQEIIEQQ